jgi:hypothetical protein
MTRQGAEMIIESLSLRIFEIQDVQARLEAEKEKHRARIQELRQQFINTIEPNPIINVG